MYPVRVKIDRFLNIAFIIVKLTIDKVQINSDWVDSYGIVYFYKTLYELKSRKSTNKEIIIYTQKLNKLAIFLNKHSHYDTYYVNLLKYTMV